MPLNTAAFQGESRVKLRSTAYLLGYLGVLPFYALALLTGSLPEPFADQALAALIGYAAVILSFMTGIHWGSGLSMGQAGRMVWSVIPALAAWLALLMPAVFALPLLVLSFILVWLADRGCGWPNWYSRLRFQLTFLVLLCLLGLWGYLAMQL
ncbi:DUF3429 domain-containing protein [Marinospirillum alkaliphilum]|uniref:DUF3429 domain-containing protein n=1 Tax=Marinospirillum alkaliphilum DSM 21637 TaxID=1122209 RepID=A0A1K1ZF94_9GAMM|nr:DUF3429 domain-containing protein [Marinospirillum alkaliphilum]SFX72849.1 Protein of unknown function [Marinospirillum alkaliphilum DSM 21637]